jgi:DNA-binding protein Fis
LKVGGSWIAQRIRGEDPFRPKSFKEVERRHVERVLRHHEGNRSRASKDLGIARATLINKIKEYGLRG